jgi:predicted MFS family arabinose efflux permease
MILDWIRKNKDLHPCVDSNLFLLQTHCFLLLLDGFALFLALLLIGFFVLPFLALAHAGLCIYAVIIAIRGVAAYRAKEVGWVTPAFSVLMVVGPPLACYLGTRFFRWVADGGSA